MNDVKLSRRALLQLAAGASTTMLASRLPAAWGRAPRERKAAQFQNPLFAGDYADPTILRVGEDFYFTNTCYRYAPGLVVWRSRDLVNWTPISKVLNHSYERAEVWAPDLVEHKGHYYIYFPMGGIFVVHAEHPSGPWSEPIELKVDDIDPGHVVGPDGTRYLYTAGGHMVELSADGLSAVGEKKQVYQGWQFPADWKTEGFWLESPKLTRRGDFYYLICAEGGTSGPPTSHMSVVARSRSPLGPWENSPHNPLIHTYSEDETWWSVGHGTLVDTPDGRWYFVYHGYRNGFKSLGRHTLLEPIEWTDDGWPRAPLGARRDQPMPAPMGVAQKPMIPLSDDFRAPTLQPTWGAWSEADMSRFQTGHGALTVRAKGDTPGHSSPLAVMARDVSYEVQVVASPKGGCGAALGLFYNPDHWLFAELGSGRLRAYGPKETLADRDWTARAAHLKIVNSRNRVEILASGDGRQWQSLVKDFDASGFNTNTLGGFQALRIALAASATDEARFTDFRYRAL
ncbi:xylosidase/arabinosidase [Capsulimonas corticalis]|uniref:Xylosidase/arabinosidase n=1 Tax=Capsulimonas corticalis TaxID=2219043 RepID=A0A402D0R3_9BACT|nr:xylosidase/arabinosidase [Capsulimonas corticalis]